MSDDRRRILDLLKNGSISVAEADELLQAVEPEPGGRAGAPDVPEGNVALKKSYQYLRVIVTESGQQKVNIRVPMGIMRAGIKLAGLMPASAKNQVQDALNLKGINLDIDKLKAEQIDELMHSLAATTIDVSNNGNSVRIFCE
jgi:hypothetical protein